jgi:hypothetical protein
MKLEAFLSIALPVIGALLAVGSVLWIKAMRRLQAGRAADIPPAAGTGRRDDVAIAVPARPVTDAQLQRWRRRYLLACVLAAAALVAYAVWLSIAK